MMQHDVKWQPFQEPLRITLARNGTVALVIGAVLAQRLGGLAHWPLATLLVLWPSLGGHWVELWFLNFLRPRLPVARAVQAGGRVAVWFIGGTGLAFAMALTVQNVGFQAAVEFLMPLASTAAPNEKAPLRGKSSDADRGDSRVDKYLGRSGSEYPGAHASSPQSCATSERANSTSLTPFRGQYHKFAVESRWLLARVPDK